MIIIISFVPNLANIRWKMERIFYVGFKIPPLMLIMILSIQLSMRTQNIVQKLFHPPGNHNIQN